MVHQSLPSEMTEHSVFEARPGLAVLLLPDSPRFTVVTISNDFVKATGIERDAAIGKEYLSLFPFNPNDPDDIWKRNVKASFELVVKTKAPHGLPLQRFDIAGNEGVMTERYWKSHDMPVLENGELKYIIHTAIDVTLQVKAEQKEKSFKNIEKAYDFFMAAPVIIGFLKGDDYIIEMANEDLLEVWGRTEEVRGKPLLEAIPELRGQGIMEVLENVRITGEPFYAYEFPITLNRHGKEEVFYFDFVYKPFYENEKSGKATGVFSVGHDVTAQVRSRVTVSEAKKEAESQKRLYETINSSTPDLIYVFGLDYRFLYANDALLTMWGRSASEAIGRSLLENGYEPWHAEMHEREIDQVVATKLPVRGDVSFPHATLGKRIYDYILVPVFGENGEVEAVAGTTRDITELKLAEQAIRESNERFRRLADDSPMFIFIIDAKPSAPVSYWNKTWLEYTGQTMDEAVGRAWDGIIHPDDIPEVMDHYTPAFEARISYFIKSVRVRRHDGEFRWYAFKGNPLFLPNGEFNGYVGVGFDIHDQKLAEEALKQSETRLQQKVTERTLELESQKNLFDNILKNSSNGITVSEMIRDQTGTIVNARTIMANDAAVKYVGLPKEQFLSLTALDLDPNIFESDYGKTCLRTLETGEPSLSQYYIEMTGRWEELTISKMDDDHLIHIFTDVTPIKEAQIKLEQMIDELKRSNTNLEEFAYAASHDLKEPIRKIQIFSDRLRTSLDKKLGEDERTFFERMETATKRMNTLIEDLLQYSYVSKGAVMDQQVNLNEVVDIVLEDLDMEIEVKKARIKKDMLPVITGQKRQLQQLFQNLIGNALKYNKPNASPIVNITSRKINGEDQLLNSLALEKGSYHLIEIHDNGIGFEQINAERIFNVFTRLHGNSEYKGSGVGLSIVRKVVENHKGRIWADSKPGEGAIFHLLLPVS